MGTTTKQGDRANRDRIVACVNACAGINPEAVPDLLAACEAWAEFAANLERTSEPGDPVNEIRERVHGARIRKTLAAIAKAKGGV